MDSHKIIHNTIGEIEYVCLGGSHIYRIDDIATVITLRKVREDKDGMKCEMEVINKMPSYYETIRVISDKGDVEKSISKIMPLNITSIRGRLEVANNLKSKYKEIDWLNVIEFICTDIYGKIHQRNASTQIYDLLEPQSLTYLLYPILPMGLPTLIYGDGGIGKSLLCQFFGMLVASDNSISNSYGLKTYERKNLLYIDWESSELTMRRRQYLMCAGSKIPPIYTRYMRSYMPIMDMMDDIEEEIINHNIDMIIIDSLGASLSGNLIDAEPVLEFINNKLRRVNVTSLIISHTPKGGETPYGSVFITNACRSQWRLRKQQTMGADSINLSLFHEKMNDDKLSTPLGFSIKFEENHIKIDRLDRIVQEEFGEHLPLREQILYLLQDNAYSVSEIKDIIGGNIQTVRNYLSKLHRENKIFKVDNKWSVVV